MPVWQETSYSLQLSLGTRPGHFCPGHRDGTAKLNVGLEGFQTEREREREVGSANNKTNHSVAVV